jgi:hypothetical protein
LITKYAGTNVTEDYAEVYSAMFFPEIGAELEDWLNEDVYLRTKFRSVLGALETRWTPFVESLPNGARVP